MMTDVANDKRMYGRVSTDKKVTCKVIDVGTGIKFEPTGTVVKNISPGGISFELNTAIPEETPVKLEINLPLATQEGPGLVSGKVVRCIKDEKTNKYEIGITYIRDRK